PEPVAPFADLIFIGEAEAALPGILATLRELRATTHDREAIYDALAHSPGLYLPAGYHLEIDGGGRFVGLKPEEGVPAEVTRQWLPSLEHLPTHSRFLTPESAFGEMFLLEISRGCPRQCRFCTAGHFDNPPRHRPLAGLLEEAREGLRWSRRVGLVAPSPSDHPDFLALVDGIAALGGEVSPSSIRIDHLDREVVGALVRSGNRSLSLAPEAGSARMRDVISKEFQEPEILAAAEHLAAAGIDSAKLYMMVGLPGETDEDVEAIIDLVTKVREVFLPHWRRAGHTGRLTVSLNQFIPKPHTPFQWTSLEGLASVAAKVTALSTAFATLGNVRLNAEAPQQTVVEATLSRADRRAADLLERVAAAAGRWRRVLPGWLEETGTDLHRPIAHDAPLPWGHITTGLTGAYLRREEARGMKGKNNRPCPPDLVGCHKCGVC
ncbi:MAG: radical SAM protein, partial [Nitrospirota bacterium]